MCGRYASFRQAQELADIFQVDTVNPVAAALPPSWNVAPTQAARIIREEVAGAAGGSAAGASASLAGGEVVRILDVAQWGLVPSWAKDPGIGARMINARSETLTEKPSFRGPAKYSRCVVPIEGFFEWQAPPAGRRAKTPFYISAAAGGPLAVAGLASLWRDELLTFTLATRDARGNMAQLHDREPVILRLEDMAAWLNPAQQDPAQVAAMLTLPRPELVFHEVSTAVNTPRNNTPDLIAPPPRGAFATIPPQE